MISRVHIRWRQGKGSSRNTLNNGVGPSMKREGREGREERAAVVFSRKVRASGKEDNQSWSQLSRRSATVIESTPSRTPPTPSSTRRRRRTDVPSATAESRNKGGSRNGEREGESENIYIFFARGAPARGRGREEVDDLSTNEWPPVKGYLPFRSRPCSFPFPFPRKFPGERVV